MWFWLEKRKVHRRHDAKVKATAKLAHKRATDTRK
jgi:hypothetical protein